MLAPAGVNQKSNPLLTTYRSSAAKSGCTFFLKPFALLRVHPCEQVIERVEPNDVRVLSGGAGDRANDLYSHVTRIGFARWNDLFEPSLVIRLTPVAHAVRDHHRRAIFCMSRQTGPIFRHHLSPTVLLKRPCSAWRMGAWMGLYLSDQTASS